jgi:hypothetical protein
MAYNESPKSLQELQGLWTNSKFKFTATDKKDEALKKEIRGVHEKIYEQLKGLRVNPLIFDTSKPKLVNISRSLSSVDIKTINRNSKPVKFKFGDGSNKKTITTAEQEQVTLMIIEEVLNIRTKSYKSFGDMWNDHKGKKKGLYKIHQDLEDTGDWWKHFELQFNEIKKTTDLPNDKFTVFNHHGGFMDYISKYVTKGRSRGSKNATKYLDASKFGQKDSWNPADVWLIQKNSAYRTYIKDLQNAQRIGPVNGILRKAFNDNVIVGISLKKTHGKPGGLRYDKINLYNSAEEQILDPTKIIKIQFDPHFIDGGFPSMTSNLILTPISGKYKGTKFKLSFKSNSGGTGDITYEFLELTGAAQLGKVPKDRLKRVLKKAGIGVSGYPVVGDHGRFNKGHWTHLVSDINASKILKIYKWVVGDRSKNKNLNESWEKFVDNMEESWNTGSSKKNRQMMQMADFLYILSKILVKYDKEGLEAFITDLFYFSQKMGQKWDFGPFGKLH